MDRDQVLFILKWIGVQTLFVLKWCAILISTVFGIVLVIRYGPGLARMVVAQVKRHLEMRRHQKRMREAELERERLIAERKAREAREAKEAQERRDKEAILRARLQRDEIERNRNIKKQYEAWKRQCTAAFENPETMDHFPYPPVVRCTDLCNAVMTPPTPCRHNLELLFKASGVAPAQLRKELRNFHLKHFHPDKFSACKDKTFENLASSYFKTVLKPWYDELS